MFLINTRILYHAIIVIIELSSWRNFIIKAVFLSLMTIILLDLRFAKAIDFFLEYSRQMISLRDFDRGNSSRRNIVLRRRKVSNFNHGLCMRHESGAVGWCWIRPRLKLPFHKLKLPFHKRNTYYPLSYLYYTVLFVHQKLTIYQRLT